jgi:uncharacterized protein YjbI with pentapeptide repeats
MQVFKYMLWLILGLFAGAASAEEFNKNCTMGMSMGMEVKTDCSVRWDNQGKVYCFSSQESKDMFMKNKEDNLSAALAFNAKVGEHSKQKVTSEQAREMVKLSGPDKIADFSGKDLSYQDLSKLDLRNAKFVDTNLFGADLRGSDLSGVDLTEAYLNLARIEGVSFANANLTDATVFQPIFEKNSFKGAKLVNTRMIGTLGAVDMSDADARNARFGLDIGNQPMGQMKFDSVGGKFANTNFEGSDINRANLSFGDFRGANLRNTNLFRVDFSKADLTGADLGGADISEADLDGTILTDVKGLDSVKGMATTKGKCDGCKK